MKKKDREELKRYIRWVANEMLLADWTFDVKWESPSDPDALANCTPIFGRKRATLRFCDDFRNLVADEQRDTVVHELIHCHFAPAQCQVEKDLERHLGVQADQLFFESFKRNVEYAVDGLAGAIAKHMPLIEWPK